MPLRPDFRSGIRGSRYPIWPWIMFDLWATNILPTAHWLASMLHSSLQSPVSSWAKNADGIRAADQEHVFPRRVSIRPGPLRDGPTAPQHNISPGGLNDPRWWPLPGLFGAIKVGTLLKFTPHPVVAGFQTTAATLLFLVQLANVSGFDETRPFTFVLSHPGAIKPLTARLAACLSFPF
jgi:hypothetical protein